MLSFKHYTDILKENFEHMDPELPHGETEYSHKFNIGKHAVEVHYGKAPFSQPHHYNVDFYVNNHMDKSVSHETLPMHDSMKIFKAVHQSVSKFIQDKKPKSLQFIGNTDEKQELYNHFAEKISKQYKGKMQFHPFKTVDPSDWKPPIPQVHFE